MMSKTSFPHTRRYAAVFAEEGSSLVEMGLACLILIPMLFGIIQLSMALYCYHYAAAAAREATRWAIVRGSTCNTNFNAAYCSPTMANSDGADGTDIAQYVKSLGYPFSGKLTTTTRWCVNSGTIPASWACSSTKSNDPANQVSVTVTYAYPLIIPFLKSNTINLGSVSSMTIVQ